MLAVFLAFYGATMLIPRVAFGAPPLRALDYIVGFGFPICVAIGPGSLLASALASLAVQAVFTSGLESTFITLTYLAAYSAGVVLIRRKGGDAPWLSTSRSALAWIVGSVLTCCIAGLGVQFALLPLSGQTSQVNAWARFLGQFFRELSAILSVGPFVLVALSGPLRRLVGVPPESRSERPAADADVPRALMLAAISVLVLWAAARWRAEFGVDVILLAFVPLGVSAVGSSVNATFLGLGLATIATILVWWRAGLVSVVPLAEMRILILSQALTTTLIGAYSQERATERRALRQRIADLQQMSAGTESDREQERTRLSREVHDELGQLLTGLKMKVRTLASGTPKDAVRDLAELESETDAVLAQAERIGTELSSDLMQTAEALPHALARLAREYERMVAFRCEVVCGSTEISLQPECVHGIRQIVREALTNVVRHAEAARVFIRIAQDGGMLRIGVEDDGKGLRGDKYGLGIIGMRERALLLGGTLEVRRREPCGTLVEVTLPLQNRI